MIDRIRLATGNAGKAREFERLFGCPVLPIIPWVAPSEDGTTFHANARIKALAGAESCPNEWVVADDSGIEVAALNGAPGVLSARFGGDGLDDVGRVEALLAAVGRNPERSARFVCALVAIGPGGQEHYAEGFLPGTLASAPRGTNGFGYDTILVPLGETRTCAELASHEKNAISHRAAAVELLRAALER